MAKGFKKFVCGVAIGTALGVLLAPKSGEKTRKELKEKYDDLVLYINDLKNSDIKKTLLNKVDEIKNNLQELESEEVIDSVKKKCDKITSKLNELKKEAAKVSKPYLEKSIDVIKDKTVDILDATLNKFNGE